MTDPFSPDELASAYLDDELDPEDRARVEADPALLARVEQFRAAQSWLASPPELDDATREALIAQAMTAGRATENVSSLQAHRSARHRLAPLLGAAAAALVIVGVAVAISNSGDDGTDDRSSAVTIAAATADASSAVDDLGTGPVDSSPAEDSGEAEAAAPGAETAPLFGRAVTFANVDALRDQLIPLVDRDAAPPTAAAEPDSANGLSSCEGNLDQGRSRTPAATFGLPTVISFDDPTGLTGVAAGQELLLLIGDDDFALVDPATCMSLYEDDLPG